MNINIKNAGSKKPSIGFGLNKRGANANRNLNGSKKKKPKKSSVFDDSDDSDDGGNGDGDRKVSSTSASASASTSDSRKIFNQELAAEQQVLRQRAEQAMAKAAASSQIYDYDAEYESFSTGAAAASQRLEEQRSQHQQPKERKSRYIAQLLATAKDRKQEHEILHERKIAREQAAEERNHEYMGKDKFITKSYKRKLEEREQWMQKDSAQRQREEMDDVRKKTGGSAMMGLNWSKMGSAGTDTGGMDESREAALGSERNRDIAGVADSSADTRGDRKGPSSNFNRRTDHDYGHSYHQDHDESYKDAEEVELDQELEEQAKRVQRLKKILAARERYLKRKENSISMRVATHT